VVEKTSGPEKARSCLISSTLAPAAAIAAVSRAMPPGRSLTWAVNRQSRPSAASPWSITRRVPAAAAKVVIVFHIVAYGTFQFVLKDLLPVHFLHLYAILFVMEVAMMLAIGMWRPRGEEAAIRQTAEVDLTPWAYAQPCAVTLLSCVVALYVVFSPIGLVGEGSTLFASVLLGLLGLNVLFWFGWHRRLIAGPGAHA